MFLLRGELHGRWRQATRAVMVLLSLHGLPPSQIAELLDCHPATVRRWISRFNDEGAAHLRAVTATSGATAVPIVHSLRGSRDIEHVGSAHDVVELEAAGALGMSRRSPTGRSASADIVAPAGVDQAQVRAGAERAIVRYQ